MLQSGAIFELKIHKNAFVSGTWPWTPLGQLTALPGFSSWFSGAALRQDREGRER